MFLSGGMSVANAQALDTAIQNGYAWLSAQSGGALLTSPDVDQAHSEALFAYAADERTLPGALAGRFATVDSGATELLARGIIVQKMRGSIAAQAMMALLTLQNADGGFGAAQGYPSNTLDTAWALRALATDSTQRDHAGRAIQWLLGGQQATGYWQRIVPDQDDELVITALATQALWQYRLQFDLQGSLDKARLWLATQKTANGNWDSTLYNAHGLLSILPAANTAQGEQAAVNALVAAQQGNGSWANDPYLTALALQALSMASRPLTNPDLVSVRGQIVDGSTGTPVAGATVVLEGSGSQSVTAVDGLFSFSGLQAGQYQLNVSAPGYQQVLQFITLYAGQQMDMGVVPLPAETGGGGATTVRLQGVATYQDENNQIHPAVGAIIRVNGLQAVTDSTGSYNIDNISPGMLEITADYGAYQSLQSSATAAAGQTLIFNPAFGGSDLVSVRGQIVDGSTGTPVAGATVVLEGSGSQSVTAVDGLFSFSGLQAGQYQLNVSAPGYQQVLQFITLYAGQQMDMGVVPLSVETGGGGATTVRLQGVATYQDENNQIHPAVGAIIRVNGLQAVTDSTGSYNIDNISPGMLEITADYGAYQSLQSSTTAAAGQMLIFNPVFGDSDLVSVRGQIVDGSTGTPVAGAMIVLEGSGSQSVTAVDGLFSFSGLQAGQYQLNVSAPGYQPVLQFITLYAGQQMDMGVVPLSAETGGGGATTVRLQGVATYQDENNQIHPAVGAIIRVNGLQAVTDSTGSYNIDNISPGMLEITADYGAYQSLQSSTTAAAGQMLIFNPVFGGYVLAGTRLIVTVTDETSGNELAGVMVRLNRNEEIQTDAQGQAVFTVGLENGANRIELWKSGYEYADEMIPVAFGYETRVALALKDDNQNIGSVADYEVYHDVVDQPLALGDVVHYRIVLTNNGPHAGNGVRLTNTLPNGVDDVQWVCQGEWGGVCGAASGQGGSIDLNAVVPVNGRVTVDVTGKLLRSGIITSIAKMALQGSGVQDPFEDNNSAVASFVMDSGGSSTTVVSARTNLFYAGVSAQPWPYVCGRSPDGLWGDGLKPPYVALPPGSRMLQLDARNTSNINFNISGTGLTPDGFDRITRVWDPRGAFPGLGIDNRAGMLSGVFLDNNEPAAGQFDGTQAGVNIYTVAQMNAQVLNPVLTTPFPFGDGTVMDKQFQPVDPPYFQRQTINIPSGATRFFLGFIDASGISGPNTCYLDNVGAVFVTIRLLTVDDEGVVLEGGGTAIADVRSNDSLDGMPPNSGNSVLTQEGQWPAGITLDTGSGQVNVAAGIAVGTYSDMFYKVCDESTLPLSCAEAMITVQVLPSSGSIETVAAVDDRGEVTQGITSVAVADVRANDSINDQRATAANTLLVPVGIWPMGVELDTTTGAVTVQDTVDEASYTLRYQLCSLAQPANCDMANVHILISSLPLAATLSVATDKPAYYADSNAVFSAIVWNRGDADNAYTLQLSVEDTAGNPVIVFATDNLGTIAVNTSQTRQQDWNTARTVAGDYVLVGKLTDSKGKQVAVATQNFRILGGTAGSPAAALRVNTDRLEYHTTDRVALGSLAQNLATNAPVSTATVTLTVTDSAALIVFSHSEALGDLPSGGLQQFSVPQLLSNAATGTYTVHGELHDGSGRLLATAATSYQVVGRAPYALTDLSGTVTVSTGSIQPGDILTRSDSATNNGTVLSNILFHFYTIRDSDGVQVAAASTAPYTMTAGQTLSWPGVTIPSAALQPGNYTVLLMVEQNSQFRLLDSTGFIVTAGGGGIPQPGVRHVPASFPGMLLLLVFFLPLLAARAVSPRYR